MGGLGELSHEARRQSTDKKPVPVALIYSFLVEYYVPSITGAVKE
jgi:hypothetical protein